MELWNTMEEASPFKSISCLLVHHCHRNYLKTVCIPASFTRTVSIFSMELGFSIYARGFSHYSGLYVSQNSRTKMRQKLAGMLLLQCFLITWSEQLSDEAQHEFENRLIAKNMKIGLGMNVLIMISLLRRKVFNTTSFMMDLETQK